MMLDYNSVSPRVANRINICYRNRAPMSPASACHILAAVLNSSETTP